MLKKLQYNKRLIRFFEWLYYPEIYSSSGQSYKWKIAKIKRWNVFLIDKCYIDHKGYYTRASDRRTSMPVWNWGSIKYLFFIRPFEREPIPKYTCPHCGPIRRVYISQKYSSTWAYEGTAWLGTQTIPELDLVRRCFSCSSILTEN